MSQGAKRIRYISSCCHARAELRRVSLREGTLVLRCTECGSHYEQPLAPPHLKLIVSH